MKCQIFIISKDISKTRKIEKLNCSFGWKFTNWLKENINYFKNIDRSDGCFSNF